MKKKNQTRRKSDLIFWGIALGLIAFLFLTPWGFKVQSWLRSWVLWTPDMKENAITNLDDQVIGYDWMIISDKNGEVYISDFDHPIFLNFWATWCSPCRSEMSSIEALHEKYKDKIDFVLVSPTEDLEKVTAAKMDEEWDFTVYVNGSDIPENLRFEVFPTTFIIDKDKQIRYKFEGAYDWDTEEVYEMLDELL